MDVSSGDRVHVKTVSGWRGGVVAEVSGSVVSVSIPVVPTAPGQPTRQVLDSVPYDADGLTVPSWRLPQPIGA